MALYLVTSPRVRRVAVSHAADLDDGAGCAVVEAELNPLMMLRRGDGTLAADGLVVLSRP